MEKVPLLKIKCPRCEGSGRLGVVNGPGLRKLREAKGISLSDMARALGVQVTGLSAIETGSRQTSLDFAVRYVQSLGGLGA
jgi:predicted transcriptional regulator